MTGTESLKSIRNVSTRHDTQASFPIAPREHSDLICFASRLQRAFTVWVQRRKNKPVFATRLASRHVVLYSRLSLRYVKAGIRFVRDPHLRQPEAAADCNPTPPGNGHD